ncbi:(2Fe-2S)-binding protein [Candidatus Dependentiae bacterium]|nr:(2Fe-2S)-binding protein [Candidatus Dependentiae bacterium]
MNCCKKNETKDTSRQAVIDNDYLLCTCMGVMKSDVVAAIDRGAVTFQALADELGVGTGCGTCVDEVMQILACKRKLCC